MNTHDIDIELPPLPIPDADHYDSGTFAPVWKKGKMEAYARAAIEVDRKRQYCTVYEEGWKDALEWAKRNHKRGCEDQEPFGYFRALPFGWTDCAATDEGAIALYERPQARGEPVSGYTMVPVEPTPQMIAAFRSGFQNELHKNDRRRTMSAEEAGLRAMLKATPQPAEPDRGEPVKLCDCERGHNGMGMVGRECDCPSNNSQPAEPVKGPSDEEVLKIAIDSGLAFRDSTGEVLCAWREDADISEYLVENARALLAAAPKFGEEE